MTERNASGESDALWAMGCGASAVVASACAALGTFLDAFLVARTQCYCLGGTNAGESFAGLVWVASRLIVFPVISFISLLAAFPVVLLAHLSWFADHGWLKAILTTLATIVSITGPVVTIVYDVATEGITGDCDPPWWPSWLPS
ncbi:hypothetical protein GCM10022252_29080 [Streptosporangium oxazolinicum]|uniref:Uncharacterized protein n=1 Tax=Streptosporangium oxazolinicum TaxID=909287 RepID=A0ABP8AUM6_9ACTN